jgi:hypothetical protein
VLVRRFTCGDILGNVNIETGANGWDRCTDHKYADQRGDSMQSEIVEVGLPNGATALVQVTAVDGGGATKTGVRDKFDFASVAGTLEGVTEAIRAALVKAAPDEVSVELHFELAVKSGVLVGLLVDGESTGSITVTLGWGHGHAAGS